MKTLNVNGNLGSFSVNLPEELREISNDYLKECTDFIHLAPNYALVGVVYKDSLTTILTAHKKEKPVNIAAVPIFIKAGDNDSEFIKSFNLGDRCVISASDLSMGNHINSPYNKITPNNIVNICQGDKNIYQTALVMRSPICLLEFKIIFISAIRAKLDDTKNNFDNPFIHKSVSIFNPEVTVTGEA